MNILVIGNGFDLAHELPTKYTDFLFFCKVINCIINDNEIDRKIPKSDKYYTTWLNSCEEFSLKNIKSVNDYIYKVPPVNYAATERDKKVYNEIIANFIEKCFLGKDKDQKLIKDILFLIFENVWIEFFLHCNMHVHENWIDFESEILNVVKTIDDEMHGLDNNYNLYDRVTKQESNRLLNFFIDKIGNGSTFKVVRDRLEKDLNKLIRLFEIYLTEYVEKIDIKVVSPDIKDIAIQKVISFNYTNTFEKLYNKDKSIECDYIHGKADSNNTIDTNNMVLGIDEYLPDDRKNKDIDFIAFKKYYQRIHKQTGCKYKEWIDIIKGEFSDYQTELEKCKTEKNIMLLKAATNKLKKQYLNKHHVYIFGHSLDVTDKDILKDLILNDNVHTTIFYYNKDVMGQQIANLVKVIGQDELIRRTGEKTIEFKQQQDMVNI